MSSETRHRPRPGSPRSGHSAGRHRGSTAPGVRGWPSCRAVPEASDPALGGAPAPAPLPGGSAVDGLAKGPQLADLVNSDGGMGYSSLLALGHAVAVSGHLLGQILWADTAQAVAGDRIVAFQNALLTVVNGARWLRVSCQSLVGSGPQRFPGWVGGRPPTSTAMTHNRRSPLLACCGITPSPETPEIMRRAHNGRGRTPRSARCGASRSPATA